MGENGKSRLAQLRRHAFEQDAILEAAARERNGFEYTRFRVASRESIGGFG
jgi:hypothetical protein